LVGSVRQQSGYATLGGNVEQHLLLELGQLRALLNHFLDFSFQALKALLLLSTKFSLCLLGE
jgi:hypothetical protein